MARKIIIDTDPGIDDILAILLVVSASPEDVEVLLISVTYGNIDIQNCLRNVVSLFHTVGRELEWRRKNGRPEGFDALRRFKPLVAVGADQPLADSVLMADYFHGPDGLGDIHTTHPHMSPAETWASLFTKRSPSESMEDAAVAHDIQSATSLFRPSQLPAHEEILNVLRSNEHDTITIVAIGPLTNLALAAAADPETFLRAKEVVVMGGAVDAPGNVQQPPLHSHPEPNTPPPPFALTKAPPTPLRNSLNARNQMTPVAEFNIFADPTAAARIFALTSPHPASTMPPIPPGPPSSDPTTPPPRHLAPYPANLPRPLNLTLFPLDITSQHTLTRHTFSSLISPLLDAGSPLAEWTSAFLSYTFRKISSLEPPTNDPDAIALALHDPLCTYYALLDPPSLPLPTTTTTTKQAAQTAWHLSATSPEDIRIETSGQWTRGMCVVDRRHRARRADGDERDGGSDGGGADPPSDHGGWLSSGRGNRVRRMVKTGAEDSFGAEMLRRIFGLEGR